MILKEYFQIVVNFYVKQFDSSILTLFRACLGQLVCVCVLYCLQVILLCRVLGGGECETSHASAI